MKFYGYKKCSTCRKGEQLLQEQGLGYTFIDITTHPPTTAELRLALASCGGDVKKLFNTSGVQYRELAIKDRLPSLSTTDALALLAGNGRLIKRPMVFDQQKATVGFKADTFGQTWCRDYD